MHIERAEDGDTQPPFLGPYPLLYLVDHAEHVQAIDTVEKVNDCFRRHDQEFAAVLEGTRFLGLVSRGQLGALMGTRFGFTLYSGHRIREHLLPDSLVVTSSTPLLEVLDSALNREGQAFYHDLALVTEGWEFLGIIPVPALLRVQSKLMREQIHLAERQGAELKNKNHELFRSLNQLRQSQGRYETLFQNNPRGIALLNADGRIDTQNTRLDQWLKGEGGQPGVGDLAELMPAADQAAYLQLISRHETDPDQLPHHSREFRLNLPRLGQRVFQIHTSWIRETGQVCAVLKDITDLRAMERQFALNEKSALLETLVGGIAHELNNKLGPVLGFADLLGMKLERMDDSETLVRYCRIIADSAQESGKIIQQLKQLSRPVTLERSQVDLSTLVADVCALIRFRLQATGTELSMDLPDACPGIWVDPIQIKQVLLNLMLNAIDAMEDAAVKRLLIRARVSRKTFAIAIQDTGQGIPPDQLTRIFDPYFTTKAPDRGTGLGLSVCLGIVKQHQGEIQLESTLGVGSTFCVSLPMDLGPSAMAEAGLSNPLEAGSKMDFGVEKRLDVLVVDDEEFITGMVQETLRSHMGWRVSRVHSGREALARLEKGGIDLVITDLRMPGPDGFAVLDWIRRSRPDLYRRTMVITGDAGSPKQNQELLDLHLPMLAKPFSANQLLDMCGSLASAHD